MSTVIAATFSDYRMVKGRSVLQIVLEVPIEHQAHVFDVLGYPMPNADLWVGVARLIGEPPSPPAPGGLTLTASERGRAAYVSSSEMEQARTRAIMLCSDPEFWRWIKELQGPVVISSQEAAEWLRVAIGSTTRGDIARSQEVHDKFLMLEEQFRDWVNKGGGDHA